MMRKHFLIVVLMVFVSLVTSQNIIAADSEDQILEKARAQGQKYEKLKKVLVEEPDQNVRLATFYLMIKNGDPAMREVALDAGLSSVDALLQASAFKEAIFRLDRLHLIMTANPDAIDKHQQACKDWIEKNGNIFILNLGKKDFEKGMFSNIREKGQVTGVHMTFTSRSFGAIGNLHLEDDNAVSGNVTLGREKANCLATTKIR